MPPEILERLQGLLRGFFDRRVEELIPSAGREAGDFEPLPSFPAPMAQDATAVAMPPQVPPTPPEPTFVPTMPQDATRVDLPPIPTQDPPIQHEISSRDPSLFESVIPLEARQALRLREGTILKPFIEEVLRNPVEHVAGPLGASGALAGRPALNAIRRAESARFGNTLSAARNDPTHQYVSRVLEHVPSHTQLDQVASRGVPFEVIGNTPRAIPRGSVVLVEPPRLPRNVREARADMQGYTAETFHVTAQPGIWEGTARLGEDFGGIIQPWSHFGTPLAGMQRIAHRGEFGFVPTGSPANVGIQIEGMSNRYSPFAGYPARTIPVRLRGPFMQDADAMGWGPWQVLQRAEQSGIVTAREVRELKQIMQRIERSSGYNFSHIEHSQRMVGNLLESKGIRGLRYINEVEDRGSVSYMIFNPKNARSTGAQFDPTAIGETELGRMLIPGAIGAGAATAAGQGAMQ